ncbi:uncharacterized protein LOC110186809 isoform X3 [Drosophila serrata]|uniref:uncharacterized protein LOC110186809 isoform X3 n=1 Tax=Drosophila serrata TaxID=7274 RepID=UPI000A1D24E6|nr:uncharacterized protein LOC110186809 isoform X3 [Drosophila serrata]
MKSDEIIEKIRNKLKESDPSRRTVVNTFQFNFTDSDGNLIKSMGTKQKTFQEILQQEKAKIGGDEEAINKMLEKFRINTQN